MKNGRVYLFLTLAILFWSGNFVVGSRIVEQISPISLTGMRWAFACLFLVPLAWLLERVSWRTALQEWRLHLLQSVLGLVGYTLLLYVAFGFTGPISAAVISAINPAAIALGAALVFGERMRGSRILGLVISFVGVLVVITGGQFVAIIETGFNTGDLLILGSVLVWSAYSLVGRRVKTPPVTATAVQAVFAVIIMAPIVAVAGLQLPADTGGWLGLGYIVIFASVASYALWNTGVSKIGPARAGIFLNLLPVFAVLIAVAIGDVLTPAHLIGGVLVLAGVLITNRVARPAQVLPAPKR